MIAVQGLSVDEEDPRHGETSDNEEDVFCIVHGEKVVDYEPI